MSSSKLLKVHSFYRSPMSIISLWYQNETEIWGIRASSVLRGMGMGLLCSFSLDKEQRALLAIRDACIDGERSVKTKDCHSSTIKQVYTSIIGTRVCSIFNHNTSGDSLNQYLCWAKWTAVYYSLIITVHIPFLSNFIFLINCKKKLFR